MKYPILSTAVLALSLMWLVPIGFEGATLKTFAIGFTAFFIQLIIGGVLLTIED